VEWRLKKWNEVSNSRILYWCSLVFSFYKLQKSAYNVFKFSLIVRSLCDQSAVRGIIQMPQVIYALHLLIHPVNNLLYPGRCHMPPPVKHPLPLVTDVVHMLLIWCVVERFQIGVVSRYQLVTVHVQLYPQVHPTSAVGHCDQQHYVCCENSLLHWCY